MEKIDSFENRAIFFVDIEKRAYEDRLSEPHMSQFLWGDVYFYRYKSIFTSSKESESKETQKKLDPNQIEFIRNTLELKKISEKNEDDHIENIGNSKYSELLTEMINSSHIDSKYYKKINAYSKLHEIWFSSKEYNISKNIIRKGESKDYINNKNKLKSHIINILKL